MAGRLPVGITCFAKWTDETWYNAEILASDEASYKVNFIDYGNSENVVEGDVVGDVGDIPGKDYIDQFVMIEDPMETLIINSRPVTLKRGQHAVTILCIWCANNQLSYPQYYFTEVNKDAREVEWRLFRASLTLDGKSVVGFGNTKKAAKKVAARRYINSIFLSGESSSQAENFSGTIEQKKNDPPSKKDKQKKRLEEFLKKKDKARANREEKLEEESRTVAPRENVNINFLSGESSSQAENLGATGGCEVKLKVVDGSVICFDNERAGGNMNSELLQLSYTNGNRSGNSYILPKGGICPHASNYSHGIRKKGSKLVKGKKVLDAESLTVAARRFIEYVKEVKHECGVKPILVSHGDDITTLLNSFALVGLDTELVEVIGGVLDFQTVVDDDSRLEDTPKSLTKLREEEKILSEVILGEKITRQELIDNAHDAMFDAELLLRVFNAYQLPPWSCTPEMLVDTYMVPAGQLIGSARMRVRQFELRRSRKLNQQSKPYLLFSGWDQTSST